MDATTPFDDGCPKQVGSNGRLLFQAIAVPDPDLSPTGVRLGGAKFTVPVPPARSRYKAVSAPHATPLGVSLIIDNVFRAPIDGVAAGRVTERLYQQSLHALVLRGAKRIHADDHRFMS